MSQRQRPRVFLTPTQREGLWSLSRRRAHPAPAGSKSMEKARQPPTSPGGISRAPDPRDLLRRAWSFSRPLTFIGLAMLTLAATTVGIILDPHAITGAPA